MAFWKKRISERKNPFSVKFREKFTNFEKFVPENLARDNLFIKRKYSHRDDI